MLNINECREKGVQKSEKKELIDLRMNVLTIIITAPNRRLLVVTWIIFWMIATTHKSTMKFL